MKQSKRPDKRDNVLAVKMTADEKRRVTEYAKAQCVNMSALVRKLLFDKLSDAGC
jgi:hypothetical protein